MTRTPSVTVAVAAVAGDVAGDMSYSVKKSTLARAQKKSSAFAIPKQYFIRAMVHIKYNKLGSGTRTHQPDNSLVRRVRR
jgi:hypothetical protein